MVLIEDFLKKFIPFAKTPQSWPQILSICILGLGSFTSGSLFTWTSPSIPILISNQTKIEPITLEEASYFTVIPPIASAVSVFFLSKLMDTVGRKKMIVFISVPQILSWILIAFSTNVYGLYLSRAISGIADSIFFSAFPTYMGEIATPHIRGSWGNMLTIGIYFSQLCMNVVGSYYDIRTTALIFGSVPVIAIIFCVLLPESPYYHIMKGREQEARECLKTLYWCEDVEDQLINMTKDVNRQISESGTYKDLVNIPTNRKALLISIAIRGAQQCSGLPAFAVYTQYMFIQAGGNISSSTSSIIYAAVLFLSITAYAFVVDKFGRRALMVFSSFTCSIILFLQATYFYVDKETTVDVSDFRWFPLVGMLLYLLGCSSGLGIIPTLMLGELFSASIKSKALAVLQITFAMYVLSVSKLFQVLTHNFGIHTPFYLFSFCSAVSTVYCYFYVPETKGKTLEEIQSELTGNKDKNTKQVHTLGNKI